LVDLNGAFAGEPVNKAVIEDIVTTYPNIPVQIGGGIRNLETIKTYLDMGVQYVIIGTQAVKEPQFVHTACREFPNHIIVGLDAQDGKVATDGWANISDYDVIELAQQFEQAGVSAIVYTDISRDGMMQGVNIDATVKLAQSVNMPIIASGGITNLNDITALCEVENQGIMGAITGRAIYEGTLDFAQAQQLADN
jgi:phosphoribosylformimino-5-aminoimidazole carboxamide ribotide isomerase